MSTCVDRRLLCLLCPRRWTFALYRPGFPIRDAKGGSADKPDILFCRFWHGHPERFIAPKSNLDYWEAKIARNRARDLQVTVELSGKGWTVLRLWELDIRRDFDAEFARVLSAIGRGEQEQE